MMPKDLPNIILLVIDCARVDHFGCYGYQAPTTPNIDALAEKSIIYDQAISSAGWTVPSFASLFTGTYPSKHGAHNENRYLSTQYPTLAELLSGQGYHTVGVCRNDWIAEATGLTRGFHEFYQPNYGNLKRYFKRLIQYPLIHGRDSWGYELIQMSIHRVLQRTHQKPFFLYLHLMELHMPYYIPSAYIDKFLPKHVSRSDALKVNQDPKKFYAGLVQMSEADFQIHRAFYDAALAYLDSLLGRFVEYLKSQKILDKTILIITSDHGESLGDHGHFDHYYVLYESLLHVPLIIHHPDLFGRGKVDTQVQLLDLYPTLLQLANVDSETYPHSQGVILPPQDGCQTRDYTYAERFKDVKGLHQSFPGMDLTHLEKYELDRKTVVRSQRYKLIHSMLGNHELFDIKEDQNEMRNIYQENSEIAKSLEEELNRWKNSFEPSEIMGEEAHFDEKMKERLKALGYLG